MTQQMKSIQFRFVLIFLILILSLSEAIAQGTSDGPSIGLRPRTGPRGSTVIAQCGFSDEELRFGEDRFDLDENKAVVFTVPSEMEFGEYNAYCAQFSEEFPDSIGVFTVTSCPIGEARPANQLSPESLAYYLDASSLSGADIGIEAGGAYIIHAGGPIRP